jgi:uncharacterized membrane protein (DUF4010 family)
MLNETFSVIYNFLLALLLGAVIGIEREKTHQQHKGTDFAGIRTFMLISAFGALSAYLANILYSWLLAVIFICFTIVIVAGYVLSSIINKEIGMTTEMSAIMTFLIGVLVFQTSQEIPILIAVAVTLILSFKNYIHEFVYNLKSVEFFDTIKFILVAFVVLPLLKTIPAFGPFDSINLYEIWLMVVFITGLSYVGYILIKTFGASNGTIITGLLGGILSSTAVVTTLATKSKEQIENTNALVIASSIASATMFLRVLIVTSILNFSLIEKLAFPLVLLSLAGYTASTVMWKKSSHNDTGFEFKSPLMMMPALKFGLFYGFILMLSSTLNYYFGSKGILFAALISGLADVDAITIFVARNPHLSSGIGITAIVLACVVNTAIKITISKFFGSNDYWTTLTKVLAPVIVIGLFLVVFI